MKRPGPVIDMGGDSARLVAPLVLLPIFLALGAELQGRSTFGVSQWEALPTWLWIAFAATYYVVVAVSFRIRNSFTALTETSRSLSVTTSWLLGGLVAVGLGLLFFLARSKSYFYGDGYIVIATAQKPLFSGISGDEVVKVLTILLSRTAATFFRPFTPGHPETAIAVLNSVGGVVAIAGLIRLGGTLSDSRAKRIFLISSSLTSACILLCFGWIEHYTWSMAALFWSLLFSIQYLKTEDRLWRPVLAWCITAGFELELLPLLFLLLAIVYLRRRGQLPSLLTLNLIVLSSSVLLAAIFNFVLPTVAIVPIYPRQANPYWVLSVAHLVDTLNITLLVAPLGLLLLAAGATGRREAKHSPDELFLGVGVTMLFLIFFWIDPTLGAPRDWDLLSLFGVPLTLYAAKIVIKPLSETTVRRALVPTACLAALIVGPSVYEKAHADVALAHLDRLLWVDPHYQTTYDSASRGITWGALVQTMTGHTELAEKYFWRRLKSVPNDDITWFNLGEIELARGRNDSAATAFERAYIAWPDHPIYVVRYAQALQALKSDKVQPLLPRIVATDSDDPKVLRFGGLVLARAGKVMEAVTLFRKGCNLRPWDAEFNANLAIAFHQLRMPDSSIYYFQRALSLSPPDRRSQLYTGLIVEQLTYHRTEDARVSLAEFRRQCPGDTTINNIQTALDQQK
jgi:hypothetical protein